MQLQSCPLTQSVYCYEYVYDIDNECTAQKSLIMIL